jgi:hypothetical protein
LPLKRLTRVSDVVELLEDELLNQTQEEFESMDNDAVYYPDEGEWRPMDYSEFDDGWEDEEDAEPVSMDVEAQPTVAAAHPFGPDESMSSSSTVTDDPLHSNQLVSLLTVHDLIPDMTDISSGQDISQTVLEEATNNRPFKCFDILPVAPLDHAFYNVGLEQPSKSFHARLVREYRILERSLPGTFHAIPLTTCH